MLSLYWYEYGYTLCMIIAALLSASTLYFYTSYALNHAIKVTPLSLCTPLAAAITGILVYYALPLGLVSLFLLSVAYHKINRPPLSRVLFFHALACACCTLLTLSVDSARYALKQTLLQSGQHTLQGLVIENKKWLHSASGSALTVALTHIDYAPIEGLLKFFLYAHSSLKVGEYVKLFRVAMPAQEQKESLLAYAKRDHLLGMQCCPFIRVQKLALETIYSKWIAWWDAWRNTVYSKLAQSVPMTPFTYFSSLFFGNKNCIEYLPMRTHFTRWGLTHYLARSGLHISLLISLWIGVLRCIPGGRILHACLLGIILCLYDQLSWSSISFNRALWLWFFYLGSWFTHTIATPLFGLCHLTLTLLLHNPWYAQCLDFQLSFFLTFVLLLLRYCKHQVFLLSSCIIKKK